MNQMNLIDNPHENLKCLENSSVYLVRGCLKYYHYLCDGFDDRVCYIEIYYICVHRVILKNRNYFFHYRINTCLMLL